MIKNRHPGNYDPVIINRVKQYLEDNIHQTYVDVTIMAKELQQKYLEYNRRKAIPFRIMVEQAYKTVLHSYGLDSNSSTDDGGNSDLEVMGTEQTNANHMNDALTSMYMNKNKSVAPTNEGELIDISSDDSDDERQNQAVVSAFDKALAATKNDNNNVPNSNHNNTDVNKSTNTEKTSVIKSATDEEILNLKVDSRKKAFDVSGPSQVANKRRKVDGGDAANIAKLAVQKNKKYKKEVFAKYVNVNFDNVGGMDKILKELCELLLHVRHPEIYRHIGLPPPRGFLLHGPPGCGKTLLAHAIAGQLDVPIIDITATEFVAGVSGESEERIREVFEQAAALAPVVLFIDEVDAISANRINAQKDMERRIVAQLLSSLDNLSEMEKGDQVLVIGATNRSDSIDPALRRVGRFDQEISLGIPDRDARCQILKIILRDLKLERPFDYEYLAQLTPGYVGADLLALATRAATTAIKRIFSIKEDNELTRKLCTFTKPADVSIVNLTDDSSFPLMDIDSTENDEVATAEQPKASNDATPAIAENGDATENMSVTDVGESEAKDSNNEKDAADAVNVDAESKGETPAKPEAEEAKEKTTAEKESEESAGTEDETAKGTETPAEMEQTETVADVVLSKPQLKLQLSLDNMLIWLTGDSPILTESELSQLSINKEDFVEAIKYVQPSAKREGFITVPDVTWDDIGSLRDIREELELAILAPVKFPGKLKTLGIQSPTGILLCGPPGCGKTLLAKAVANEAGINFISVKGPELLNMYVGESERAVRQCFQRARNSAPCVIFFDEFDSLCPRRSDSSENGAGMRVVNQLLTEMDGVEGRNGVFLMAATNRPDIIDPAVLRPGRFDKTLYVGLPEQSDRTDILQALTKNGTTPPLDSDVDLSEIAFLTGGYTGADLAGLVRQASLQSLKDSIRDSKEDNSTSILSVSKDHFLRAIQNVKPSVNAEDRKIYEILKKKYAVTESTGGAGN